MQIKETDRLVLTQDHLASPGALKTLSSFGMRYDDMVLRQSQAIGPMEDQFGYKEMNPFGLDNDDIYGAFAALING